MHCFDDAAVINSHFVVKHVVIVGTGIAGLWLLAKAYTTYQKKQRRCADVVCAYYFIKLNNIFAGKIGPLQDKMWLFYIRFREVGSPQVFHPSQ